MTLQKRTMPLVLMMFTVMCALPASGAIPAAIAQEEDDTSLDDDNLASDIVSDVLDDSGNADDENDQDATNTAAEDSNQDQTLDQDDISTFGDDTADIDDVNVAVPFGIPIDIGVIEEEAPPITPTPPEEEEEPPEFEAFCFVWSDFPEDLLCLDTEEECVTAAIFLVVTFPHTEIIGDVCDGVEQLPPDALVCTFVQEQGATGVSCLEQ